MYVPESLWIALARIAGADWPPTTEQSASLLVQQSVSDGLLMLLAERTDVPRLGDALRGIGAMRLASLKRTELILSAAAQLHTILGDEPYVILKGCDYAFRLYDKPTLRQMADVDILVPRARMSAVIERLRAGGAVQEWPAGAPSHLDSHHETMFDLGGVRVEPHHSFIQGPRHRVDYDAIWSRRMPFATAVAQTFRLADEDAILYHALSLCIKEFDVPLVRYLDLYLQLARFEGDPNALVERAREWRMQRALCAALVQAITIFPELAPRWEPVSRALVSNRVEAFLKKRVLPEPLRPRARMSRREQLWRKFQLMDGYRERVGFALYHAYALVAGSLQARFRTESR